MMAERNAITYASPNAPCDAASIERRVTARNPSCHPPLLAAALKRLARWIEGCSSTRKEGEVLADCVLGPTEEDVEPRDGNVHELGIELPNPFGLRDPAFVLAREEEVPHAVRAKVEVERSDPQKSLEKELGLRALPQPNDTEVSRETVQSAGVARTELHGALEGAARAEEVPVVVEPDAAERGVGCTQTLVELERPLRGLSRSYKVVPRARTVAEST